MEDSFGKNDFASLINGIYFKEKNLLRMKYSWGKEKTTNFSLLVKGS